MKGSILGPLVLIAVLVGAAHLSAVMPAWAGGALGDYQSDDLQFLEGEFGSKKIYYHQRMIDGALVEKDYILYQFDRDTDQLLAKKIHWRQDLPGHLPPNLISRAAAEAMVEGDVLFSRLYIISPESDVYALDPAPANPCWVVRSRSQGRVLVTIVDALEGVVLGYGVPPPYTAFSLTGPWEFNPCSGAWTSWMNNAKTWFNTMGYSCEGVQWPAQKKVRSHIQSGLTAMFYELAHGGSDLFQSGCLAGEIPDNTTATEIETWIAGYTKMPFAFIGSCGGMCDTGDGTFAYELRKGEAESTAVVGYCDMAESKCSLCWDQSIAWQSALFNYMNQGYSVKEAFDLANADYPACGLNACMRFAGDEDWAVVPVVKRDPWPPQVTLLTPNGGEVMEYGTEGEIEWIASDNVRVDSLVILLSTDGGVTFPDTVAAGEPNDSSYTWAVPDIDSKTARIRIVAIDAGLNQAEDLSDADFTLWGTTSGLDQPGLVGLPKEVVLRIASGNPGRAHPRIVFGLPGPGQARIDVYDIQGRLVRTLLDDTTTPGYHSIDLGGRAGRPGELRAGVYFIRLVSSAGTKTVKLVLTP